MDQNLKRTHDEISSNHANAAVEEDDHQQLASIADKTLDNSSTTTTIDEPQRKKLKASNVDEFIEDTRYWYHIIANLDIGSTFNRFDQLQKGLTDPQKVIENLNQLWHVNKVRLILESLDCSDPYWSEDWFELVNNDGPLPTNITHSQDDDLKLKNKVTAAELGLTGEISKEILMEYISKREDIESHGLFLLEKLFKRCRVQSVEEISEIMDKCIEIDESHLSIFDAQLFEDYLHDSNDNIRTLLEKWKKYILPRIVKTQNELNMIDAEPIVLEDDEEAKAINNIIPTITTNDNTAFLLDTADFSRAIRITDDEDESGNYEILSEVFYYTYLFDLELPDEKGRVGQNFAHLMHADSNNNNDNVFLSILEITMKMFKNGVTPLEHQELEVSEMRLGVSLMILDCLNKELTCLIMSKGREQSFMLYRPLVRAILDNFIVDYHSPTSYEKYIFTHSSHPDLQPMINIMTGLYHVDEGPIGDIENITWDISQQQRGVCDWLSSDFDEQTDGSLIENHPLWGDVSNLKEQYLATQTNAQPKVSRKNIDESMFITYYPNDGNPITEPISEQNMVSFFKCDYADYCEPSIYDQNLDNLIENRSIDCNYKDDKSLHLDLTRIMRRGGVKSNDEGVLLEAYTTLKNYIACCLQSLEESVKDGVVQVEDIAKITGLLTSTESGNAKEHSTLQVPFYYKLDYKEDTAPAKSCYDECAEDLDNTEIVKLVETENYSGLIREECLGADLYNVLRDEQMGVLCDSFVKTVDGSMIRIYTPIIKYRVPELYEQFFSTEEKRNTGLDIGTVHFEVQEDEKLDFDEKNIMEWLTRIYTGQFEKKEGNTLTIEKLVAKWKIQTKSDEQVEDVDTQEETEESDSDEDEYEYEYGSDESSDGEENKEENQHLDPFPEMIERKIELSKDVDQELDTTSFENLSQLFLDDESKDFPFIVNNHKIKVHKYILGMRSSYFKVLFAGDFSDKNVSEYDVSDFFKNSESLQLLCYFLYHDTLDSENFTPQQNYYTFQNLVDLLLFSQFILNEKLKQECKETFSKCLNYEQVVGLLAMSLQTNDEEFFKIAHTLLLKTTYPYYCCGETAIIDEEISKYYQVLSTCLTVENVFFKLDYLTKVSVENSLHSYFLEDAKLQIENIHWFIANRASSFDNKFIRTLPQPIQDLTNRFYTHDNFGMASFEIVTEEPEQQEQQE